MKLLFSKYHGAGNDFVLFDARNNEVREYLDSIEAQKFEMMCHRRFGVGADGIMFLEDAQAEGYDFRMRYFNSDGKEGTMCGNGGRCIVRFADDLGIGGKAKRFIAVDGEHHATLEDDGTIALGMMNVEVVHKVEEGWFLDTGSPHLVLVDEDYETKEAIMLRRKYDANINFLDLRGSESKVRTYERGVEDETWACGTGTTAAAMVHSIVEEGDEAEGEFCYYYIVKGGKLRVSFKREGKCFNEVVLCGPAEKVFEGSIEGEF